MNLIVTQAETLAGFIWDEGNFFNPAYLFCTAGIALVIWLTQGRPKPLKEFIFPSEIYGHSSTQTDWRLSSFNIAFVGLGGVSLTNVSNVVSGAVALPGDGPLEVWAAVAVSLILVLVVDLGRYIGHRLHHESPAFWPFHAVHHSAEVLTPLTSWRVHPAYFLINTFIASILIGLFVGLSQQFGRLQGWIFLGPALILAIYFIVGAHLRHSHFWVNYPSWLEHILISPAQHQIHHSQGHGASRQEFWRNLRNLGLDVWHPLRDARQGRTAVWPRRRSGGRRLPALSDLLDCIARTNYRILRSRFKAAHPVETVVVLPGTKRLHGLDQLRGAAAFLVLGYHVWTEFGVLEIFSHAYLGVDFFFMLSGYVMARTYEASFISRTLSWHKFLAIRFRRLWAPITIGAIVGFAILAFQNKLGTALAALIPGLFLLPNLLLARPFLLNRPAWSIFFEIVANAIHAVILYRVSARVLIAISLICTLFLWIYCLPLNGLHVGFRSSDFLAGIPRVLLTYSLGVALWRSSLPTKQSSGSAALLLIGCLVCLPIGLGWDILFVLVACPIVVALAATERATKIGRFAGALSYPLYAVHMPMLEASKVLGLGPVTGAACAVGMAIAVHYLVDRWLPLRSRRSEPRRSQKSVV